MTTARNVPSALCLLALLLASTSVSAREDCEESHLDLPDSELACEVEVSVAGDGAESLGQPLKIVPSDTRVLLDVCSLRNAVEMSAPIGPSSLVFAELLYTKLNARGAGVLLLTAAQIEGENRLVFDWLAASSASWSVAEQGTVTFGRPLANRPLPTCGSGPRYTSVPYLIEIRGNKVRVSQGGQEVLSREFSGVARPGTELVPVVNRVDDLWNDSTPPGRVVATRWRRLP